MEDALTILFGLLFIASEALSFIKSVQANGILQAIINLVRRKETKQQ